MIKDLIKVLSGSKSLLKSPQALFLREGTRALTELVV
jgi:hypothetical protein